jgi:antirestriction protein ArdC
MPRRNYNNDGPNAEDRAWAAFTDMMIQHIKEIQKDWKKPWFSEAASKWPKNMSGREYNGMNAIMLMLQSEKQGYTTPVWATFDRVAGLNFVKDNDGKRQRKLDDNGQPLPLVSINKGEKSTPVFITTFTVVNKETREKIKYDDYKQMAQEERAKYNVYPKLQVYNVFNVAAQTNLKESRPELYAKIVQENQSPRREAGETTTFEPLDKMISGNLWFCPVKEVEGDNCYYSVSKDEIVLPPRATFVDGESFAGNFFHEATHSLGSEHRLNRLAGAKFGSKDYAVEELIAEMTAAAVSSRYGMTKHVKEDSAAYLKSWLKSLNESPEFIKTVLTDVRKAASVMTQRIDKIQVAIDEGKELHKEDFPDFEKTKPLAQSLKDEMAAKYAGQQSDKDVAEGVPSEVLSNDQEEQSSRGWRR